MRRNPGKLIRFLTKSDQNEPGEPIAMNVNDIDGLEYESEKFTKIRVSGESDMYNITVVGSFDEVLKMVNAAREPEIIYRTAPSMN